MIDFVALTPYDGWTMFTSSLALVDAVLPGLVAVARARLVTCSPAATGLLSERWVERSW